MLFISKSSPRNTLRQRFICLLGIVGSLVGFVPLAVMAETPETWKEIVYSYRDGTVPLTKVLKSFAKTMGLSLKMDTNVSLPKIVSVNSEAATPTVFIEKLSAANGLQWFVHAGKLHISNSKNQISERITVGTATPALAKQALLGLKLFEPKFGWGELEDSAPIAIVSGPAAYINLIKKTVGKSEDKNLDSDTKIMVFRLKYASAADVDSNIRDRVVTRRGVATILRSMLGVEHDSQSSISSFKSPGPIATAKTSASATNATSTGTTPGIKKPDALTIEAYPALNAVLIKDQSDKFNYYDELIKSLDIKAQQVEISALIVDVDVDKLNEWSAGLTIGDSQHSVSSQPDRNALESKATPNIGNLSPTLVIWGQNQLSLRLRALESNGRAEVLSRPSILTMSDQSAVLDMNRTAYFKLIGERSVDLKSMTVGTMLRVTPHVLGDAIDDGIRIDIDIEDGSIDSAGEQGDTPLTTRSTISTQAVVKTHQALVIGGYRREQNQDIKSRVPLLSNLPIFGKLFSNELTGMRQRERLFVLTARVLDADK